MARVLFAQSRAPLAVVVMEGIRRRRPLDAGMHVTLGLALLRSGDVPAADAELRRAVELEPAYARAKRAMALLHADRHEPGEELLWLRRAVADDPQHAGGQLRLAEALWAMGRSDEAADHLRQAATLLAPKDFGGVAAAMVRRLWAQGAAEAATSAVDRARALAPHDPEIEHVHRAMHGKPPERASDAYVVQHFDRFAGTFDMRLEQLRYKVPEALTGLLNRSLDADVGQLDVLDAGCGTGLCGPPLRPLAKRLVGVDLSPRMLAQAAARGVYDELHEAELTAWLTSANGAFDAVVAADVLIYFGDIVPVLAACRRALRAGGLFVFSVERSDTSRPELTPGGRWVHSLPVVRKAATSAGLDVVAFEECDARMEDGIPVKALLAACRRE